MYAGMLVAYKRDPTLYGTMKVKAVIPGGHLKVETVPETETHEAKYEVFAEEELALASEFFVAPQANQTLPLTKVENTVGK